MTKQNYAELVQLYTELESQGLQILGFPCNQFAGQEPGTNQQIHEYTKTLYNVTFPVFEKIDVNGENACEIYRFLKDNSELFEQETGKAKDISWNFAKFIVDGDGKVVKYHGPRDNPLSFKDELVKML